MNTTNNQYNTMCTALPAGNQDRKPELEVHERTPLVGQRDVEKGGGDKSHECEAQENDPLPDQGDGGIIETTAVVARRDTCTTVPYYVPIILTLLFFALRLAIDFEEDWMPRVVAEHNTEMADGCLKKASYVFAFFGVCLQGYNNRAFFLKLDRLETGQKKIDSRLDQLEAGQKRIEETIANTNKEIANTNKEIANINKAIANINKKLDQK